MTALSFVAVILITLFLALWAAGVFVMTVIEYEERMLRFTGRADMYVSAEEYESAGGQ